MDPSTPTGPPQETSFADTVEQLEDDLATVAAYVATLPDMSANVEALGNVDGKPPKPIMGEVIALSKDSWSAWTGGKPKSDWTGLDPSSQLETTSPNQLRPVYVSAAQKGYNHRRTGMTTLFNSADDFISFQNSVWNHLTNTGMDSIAYLPDPTDETKMSNVVKSHARYTVQSAQLLIKKELVRYDTYDKMNDKAARAYLLASLAVELSNKIAEKLEESDPFPIVWLQFLKAIQSTSIERFEDLKSSIKLRLPSQYPGENLEHLAAQFRKDAVELTTAGQYDHNLTLSMMKTFLLAGGSGNEDFRFPLRATKQKLEQALLDIGFKERGAANEHMINLRLTYKDVCTQAEDIYRTLFDRKEWPPARNVRDSKAPPSAYGNAAIGNNVPITRAEVLNLIQMKPRFNNGDDTNKKPENCNKCGEAGHWAKECPDNVKHQSGKPRAQRQGTHQGFHPSNDRNARKPGWRSTPPPPGSSTTKKTDTHTFHWCANCKRWTTTHTTETHTGGKSRSRNDNSGTSSAAMISLVQDPSVWTTDNDVRPSMSDILFIIWNLPLFLKILVLLSFGPLLPTLVTMASSSAAVITNCVAHIDWKSIVELTLKYGQVIFNFFQIHYQALLAPLLWTTLPSAILWHRLVPSPKPPPAPDEPIVKLRHHRRLCQRLTRIHLRRHKKSNFNHKSIKTEGLHRRYPINLRAMGKFVGRNQAPTFEKRRLQLEVEELRNEVFQLTNSVQEALLQRQIANVPGEPIPWPRQQPLTSFTKNQYRVPPQEGTWTPSVCPKHSSRLSTCNTRAGRHIHQQQLGSRREAEVYPRTWACCQNDRSKHQNGPAKPYVKATSRRELLAFKLQVASDQRWQQVLLSQ